MEPRRPTTDPPGPPPAPTHPDAEGVRDIACAQIAMEGPDPLLGAVERHRARLGLLPALEAAEGELAAAAEALEPPRRRRWPFSRARPAPPAPAAQLRLRSALRGLELHLWALDRELHVMEADRRALASAPDPALRALADEAAALQVELREQMAALRALLETASTPDLHSTPAARGPDGLPAGAELIELARAAAAVLHPRTEAWAERARAFDRDAAALRAAAAEVDALLARRPGASPAVVGHHGD